jgi:hypothetical protein
MCFGFWPKAGWLPCLIASGVVGLLLLTAGAPTLPALGCWLIPLTSVAGTMVVMASVAERNTGSS